MNGARTGSPRESLGRAGRLRLIVILAALTMVGPFTIDAIFPAFGVISRELAVDAVAVQQTISVYLLAFAVVCIGLLNLGCGRALRRLHRDCPCLAAGARPDRGLLRFYCHGFDLPLRVSESLTFACVLLLALALIVQAHLLLICAIAVLLLLSQAESHYGRSRRRQLQAALIASR